MKKRYYVICLCMLTMLVCGEIKKNYSGTSPDTIETSSNSSSVVTARFASLVEKENRKERKIAYLTFDDGPSMHTEQIRTTLKEKNVKATFFLVTDEITGDRVKSVQNLVKDGHEVGIHTACHEQDIIYADKNAFLEDFDKANKRILEVTGQKARVQRFPWGSNNGYIKGFVDEVTDELHKRGVKSFDWTVSGEDALTLYVSKNEILKNVKKDLCRFQYPIILLHDTNCVKNTPKILGELIDWIREQGYEFDVLSEREEYQFPASWRK